MSYISHERLRSAYDFSCVKAICFDFDGVLTNNNVYVDQAGLESVSCSRSDGFGIQKMNMLDIPMIVISTEANPVVRVRCEKLGLHCINGVQDKLFELKRFSQKVGVSAEETMYVGNDINDLSCLEYVGFPVIVGDSFSKLLMNRRFYKTQNYGGMGAVREICEKIYDAKVLNEQRRIDSLPADRPIAKFPAAQSVGFREWGEEILLVLSSGNYTMKKLTLSAGKEGGLQYHRIKDEASYVISGRLLLKYENEAGQLVEKEVGPGDWFHFPAGCIHQEIALTDVVRIEVSTPHFNDRVRVEGFFNISEEDGLPTTSYQDIQVK